MCKKTFFSFRVAFPVKSDLSKRGRVGEGRGRWKGGGEGRGRWKGGGKGGVGKGEGDGKKEEKEVVKR